MGCKWKLCAIALFMAEVVICHNDSLDTANTFDHQQRRRLQSTTFSSWAVTSLPRASWHALACDGIGMRLLAGHTSGYLYISSDYGATWTKTSLPQGNWGAAAMASNGMRMVAAQSGGAIYASADYGVTWAATAASKNAQWGRVTCDSTCIRILVLTGGYYGRVYMSSDFGATWVTTSAPNGYYSGVACNIDCEHIAAGTADGYGGSLLVSHNYGATWTESGAPRANWVDVVLDSTGAKIVAVQWMGFIYSSSDYGVTFTKTGAAYRDWSNIASDSTTRILAAGVASVNMSPAYIYVSFDYGETWTAAGAPPGVWTNLVSNLAGTRLAASHNDIYDSGRVYVSPFWPTSQPTGQPTGQPSGNPTGQPSSSPTEPVIPDVPVMGIKDASLTFSHSKTRQPVAIKLAFEMNRDMFMNEEFKITMPRFTNGHSSVPAPLNESVRSTLRISPSVQMEAVWVQGVKGDTASPYANSEIILRVRDATLYPRKGQRLELEVLADNGIFAYCSFAASFSTQSSRPLEAFIITSTAFDAYLDATGFPGTRIATIEHDQMGEGCNALSYCSGHGLCDFCRERCECFDGFGSQNDRAYIGSGFSPTCRDRTCPVGVAVAAVPTSIMHAHDAVECSNAGVCNRLTGTCQCHEPWTGTACDKLRCPNDCSGHGACASITEMARLPEALPLMDPDRAIEYGVDQRGAGWDADVMRGACAHSYGAYMSVSNNSNWNK